MRKPFMAGNWKMNKTRDEALQFIYAVNQALPNKDKVESVICAPAILLRCLVKRQGEELRIGAQNMHFEENGAFTGEISPQMIKTTGVDYVIIGHSERRQMFNETDETVNLKAKAALKNEITPIICCGETLEEREGGKTEVLLKAQITKDFAGIAATDVAKCVVAYEPIWAIGTGKTASSEMANETCGYIREVIASIYSKSIAEELRILYGGSVKPSNVDELMAQPHIDGGLVGGASLDAESFIKLVLACSK